MKDNITTEAPASAARDAFFAARNRLSCLRVDKDYGRYCFLKLSKAELDVKKYFEEGFYLTEEGFYHYEWIDKRPVLTEFALPAERLEALNTLFAEMIYTDRLSDEKLHAIASITGYKPTRTLNDTTLVVYAEILRPWGSAASQSLSIHYNPENHFPFYLSSNEISGAYCGITTGPELNTLHEVIDYLKRYFLYSGPISSVRVDSDNIERVLAEVNQYLEVRIQDEHHLRETSNCCSVM